MYTWHHVPMCAYFKVSWSIPNLSSKFLVVLFGEINEFKAPPLWDITILIHKYIPSHILIYIYTQLCVYIYIYIWIYWWHTFFGGTHPVYLSCWACWPSDKGRWRWGCGRNGSRQVDPDKSGHVDFPDFLRRGRCSQVEVEFHLLLEGTWVPK